MRLTEKNENKDMDIVYSFDLEQSRNTLHALIKLGQLEDIEDELGIDLITLFKAIKGIWVKNKNKVYYVGSPYLCFAENNKRELEMQFRVADIWYYIKDYRKNWALTKEELE